LTCALVQKLLNKSPQKLEIFSEHFGNKDEQKLTIARKIVIEEDIEKDFQKYQVTFIIQ